MADTLPARRKDVQVRDDGGDAVVLVDLAGNELCALNGTARAIWELCDSQTDPSEMVEAICALHGEDRERVAREVTSVLEALAGAGALEVTSAP